MSSIFIYVYLISLNYSKFFSREIRAIIRHHTNSHTTLRFTTKSHIKRKNKACHKSLDHYGPDDAIQSKVLSFAFGLSAATKRINTQKSFSENKVPGVADCFLPRTFYKNSALSQLSKRAERSFIF